MLIVCGAPAVPAIVHCPAVESHALHRILGSRTLHQSGSCCVAASQPFDLIEFVFPGSKEDTVACLLAEYGEHARTVRLRAAPGAARAENSPLQRNTPLAAQMPLLGSRDYTYRCLLASLARIFKRWTRRMHINHIDSFRRGLAHILVLSCAGSGVCLRDLMLF